MPQIYAMKLISWVFVDTHFCLRWMKAVVSRYQIRIQICPLNMKLDIIYLKLQNIHLELRHKYICFTTDKLYCNIRTYKRRRICSQTTFKGFIHPWIKWKRIGRKKGKGCEEWQVTILYWIILSSLSVN